MYKKTLVIVLAVLFICLTFISSDAYAIQQFKATFIFDDYDADDINQVVLRIYDNVGVLIPGYNLPMVYIGADSGRYG